MPTPPNDTHQTWQRTGVTNLVRHKSGRYYARVRLRGKLKFISLNTRHLTIARPRLRAELDKVEQARARLEAVGSGRLSFGQCAELYRQKVQDGTLAVRKSTLSEATKRFYLKPLAVLDRTWPELASMPVSRVTYPRLRDWLESLRRTPAPAPPGARKARQRPPGPTIVNACVVALRRILDVAVDRGAILANPAAGLRRVPVPAREVDLPSRDQFPRVIAAMRARGGRGLLAADLAEGLAYTGMRIGEAAALRWGHVDLAAGRLTIPGAKSAAARRTIPLIRPGLDLFASLAAKAPDTRSASPVFLVKECQKTLDVACALVGAPRMRQHDLRKLFGTTCLEAGVDVGTVADWMGHADRGALLLKTYRGAREAHGQIQAARVTFAAPAGSGDPPPAPQGRPAGSIEGQYEQIANPPAPLHP